MTLKDIIKDINAEVSGNADVKIKGIAYDSRKVEEGFLFIAIKGFETDGHKYIASAIEKGAVAVIGEDDLSLSFLDSYLNLPVGDNFISQMQNMILKTVTTVSGYEPFVFTCTERGHLYGEAPSISKLKENFKEDSK